MSIEGLGASLGLLVLLVLWIAAPTLNRKNRALRASAAAERQQERLLTHYERILTGIRDLDEDFATGKIDEAAYRLEREGRVTEGIEVLRELDAVGVAVGAAPKSKAGVAEIDAAIDRQIEQAVAALRKAKA